MEHLSFQMNFNDLPGLSTKLVYNLWFPSAALLYATISLSTGRGLGVGLSLQRHKHTDCHSSCVSYQLYKDQLVDILINMRLFRIFFKKK